MKTDRLFQVITSSFAAILDPKQSTRPGYVYSEKDWNPITEEEAIQNPANGYRASKTFAEKASWEFVEKEKPNFTLATVILQPPIPNVRIATNHPHPQMNPPLVLGPIIHNLQSLDALNTSNQRIRDIMTGKCKETIPETGTFIWVDVRDLALAHVKAAELEQAGGKRYFLTAGYFSNREIANIVRKNFPDRAANVPESAKGGDYPDGGMFVVLCAVGQFDANFG